MKTLRSILWLSVVLTLSCDNDSDVMNNPPPGTCVVGQGAIVSESRSLANFNSINDTIFADIFITQGPLEDVIIEAQQNILEQINTQVVNGELIITLDQCVDIDEAVKVRVTIPEIENLTLTGVGSIIAQNEFTLTDLDIVLTGVGDFDLKGVANTLNITMAGIGDVKAFDLIVDVCDINIAGLGDAEVFVNDELDVTIAGNGTVFYKGNPAITSNISGTGSIVDAN